MARRSVPEVNAGSMADIAFLLLIFFLVTTDITSNAGIAAKLPPKVPKQEQQEPPINERNLFNFTMSVITIKSFSAIRIQFTTFLKYWTSKILDKKRLSS